jgi:hypothetical protein
LTDYKYDQSEFVPVGGSFPHDQEYWLGCLATSLSTCISRDKYCKSLQSDLQDILQSGLTNLSNKAMQKYGIKSYDLKTVRIAKILFQIAWHNMSLELINFGAFYADKGHLIGALNGKDNLIATFTNNADLIAQEHYPLVNFAWMITCKDRNFYSDGSYKYMIINCPVDVRLYDSESGDLVAEIVNDEATDIEDSSVSAFMDANGQKVFILPTDGSYNVKITATDAGTVNYCLLEGNASDGYTNRVDYLDIPVTTGDEISGTVAESGAYTLEKDGTECSSEVQTDITRHEVTLNAEENGNVSGSGSYMKNEFVIAHAVPDTGADFDGWYDVDGKLVSEEADYRFRVDGDTEFTAKFKERFGLTAVVEDNLTYTGTALKPEVKVYDGVKELTAGADYTITYKNNKNAYIYREGEKGFDSSKAPCVIVTGKGNYKGKDTAYFVIEPILLSEEDAEIQAIPDQKEDGKVKRPVPSVKLGKSKLKAGTDFSVTYLTQDGTKTNCKEAGEYIARISGKGNYTGSVDCRFVIYSSQLILISKAKLQKIPDSVYTSEARDLSADVKLSYNKKDLIEGTDYKIVYNDDHTSAGKKSITIIGLGGFTGSRTAAYNITGRELKKAKISGIASSYQYTGEEITVPFVITYVQGSGAAQTVDTLEENKDYSVEYEDNYLPGTAKLTISGLGLYSGTIVKNFKIMGGTLKNAVITNFRTSVDYSGQEILQDAVLTVNGVKLTPGTDDNDENADYVVSYSKNLNAGNATVTFKGINGYTGSIQKKFSIKKKVLNNTDFELVYSDESPYVKGGSTPEVTLSFNGNALEPSKDYTVSYKNNKAVTSGATKIKPLIVITGKGNFSGSLSKEFTITPRDFSKEGITMTAKDVVVTGKAGKWKSVPVITDMDGKTLKAGTDYAKEIQYYATISGVEKLLTDTDIVEVGTEIRVVATGTGSYYNTVETTYRIVKKDISKASVKVDAKTYTGKEVTLSPKDITITCNKEKLTDADYVIDDATYKNNIKKGKATVVIRGVGDYGNSKTITFTIGAKGIFWWFRNLMQ